MSSAHSTDPAAIPGYDFGSSKSATAPISEDDLHHLEEAAGWSENDAKFLANHADLFRAQAEPMVDSWRAAIGRQKHLANWFTKPDGTPDDAYKASVKRRF